MSVSNTTAPVIGCGSTAELQQQIAALSAELAASREREARMRGAIDAAANIIGDAPWWADIWADHAAALDRARDRISQAALRGEVKP